MTLQELIDKQCLIGLSYFNTDGEVLKQSQLCGSVITVDEEEGISIQLYPAPQKEKSAVADKPPIFKLPPTLTAWFAAPKGEYRDSETGSLILDPDFLVTWDIHQTKDDSVEGQHEWWEWRPRTESPQVG